MVEKSSSQTSNVIVAVSGGFDPLHEGHLALLEEAATLGDQLIVGVNSDQWLLDKKGYVYMRAADRIRMLEALRCVDFAVEFEAASNGSAVPFLLQLLAQHPDSTVIFANGGDRSTSTDVPESVIGDWRLSFRYAVGSNIKSNSSSRLIDTPAVSSVARPWGSYQVLHSGTQHKVKTVKIAPDGSTSIQSHQHRAEHFVCVEGTVHIRIGYSTHILQPGDTLRINPNDCHQLSNHGTVTATLIEVQTGTCLEKDITRYEYTNKYTILVESTQ